MPDHAAPGLPRIALVFGDAKAAAHVRDAVSGHADIVYASCGMEFDATRMQGARAALVNLDDGEWLDGVEAKLNGTGIAVVFNDPEISQGLEGWERARWLRHLLAKLSGSTDVDPPRPEPAAPQVAAMADMRVDDVAKGEVAQVHAPAATDNVVAERPLTHEEIETMTADFAAEQESVSVQSAPASSQPVQNDAVGPIEAALAAESPAAHELDRDTAPVAPSNSDFNPEGDLDVDTETLSAMIDARLAEPESQTPSDSSEVWRVVSGGAAPSPHPETVMEHPDPPMADPAVARTLKPDEAAAVAEQDDADVLAGLPSLEDWQLVGPEVPGAQAPEKNGHKLPEPTLSDSLAGLELVPMETVAPIRAHVEPIEMWLNEGEPGKPQKGGTTRANVAGGKS